MVAPVAKGIILSISIITALGLAVYENPQIQSWLEEQRRKIAELLRQIGEELDPQARREAEAFAFEGRTVVDDEKIRREAEGSREAAALATGRSFGRTLSNSTVRRIPVMGPTDPNEAEERRRKGREYLAQRNQQLYELQQRRKAAAKATGAETPPTPTFDELVDSEGNLKGEKGFNENEMPDLRMLDPLPDTITKEMKQVERHLAQPIAVAESSSAEASGWAWGSALANPFADEYAIDRSITPKPPVPPKIELDPVDVLERAPTPPISVPDSIFPTSTDPQPVQESIDTDGLSYEEQMAIALSLSEQESSNSSATVRRNDPEDDADLEAAIAASLKEMDHQQAAHAIAYAEPVTPKPAVADDQPLVDLTPSTPPTAPRLLHGDWAELYGPQFSPSREPLSLAPQFTSALSEASDELYRLTPELTKARLASHDAHTVPSSSSSSSLPFDPVRHAAGDHSRPVDDVMDASFYSAHEPSPAPSSATFDRDSPQLINIDEAPHEGQRTPTSRAHSSFGYQTDSDSETWASASAPVSRATSRAHSRPRSEVSNIEVIDLDEDSDVDMLSEEGDGVATPDSWSEVDSRAGDSDTEQDARAQPSRVSL